MLARFGCVCLLVPVLALAQGWAQAPASTPAQSTAPPATQATAPPRTQIRTGTQLVVVDVVVQDSAGHPVLNLPRDAFHVAEGKAAQTVSSFEEHSTANPPKPGPELPKFPPGTFTNYTPVPPSGALNVLLVDALNTPMPDQSYLRNQLKEYVNKAQPGARVAIFGLNTRLFLLQGFTSNPETLKDAVNHKLIPRSSHLMDDPLSGASDTSMSDSASDAGLDQLAHDLQQFEAVEQSYKLQLRLQYTLDAFNALAHYLSAFPGRKNLFWFSGSFPINILPDATLDNPFSVLQVNEDEFRDTTELLSRSEVAVYPIDARGLMTQPAFNASNSGRQYARNPSALTNDISKFNESQAQEHFTMEQMAADTGGRAFYNTNGLAAATATALESGSNYYTLAYTPTDRTPHGEYRSIHVELTGAQAAAGLKLSYRRGYYAEDPQRSARTAGATAAKTPAPGAAVVNGTAGSATPLTPAQAAAAAYNRAAMLHGAPAPEDILFKARVLPVSPATDADLTPDDTPSPTNPFKGPYRRYNVDMVAPGGAFRLSPQPDGKRTGTVEFKTYVYDVDGKLLNVNAKAVQLNLPPDSYKQILTSGLGMHLQVSAPARSESWLRIAVHDLSSNRFGVIEIPASSVSRLPPPVDPAPATPASAAPSKP